MKTKALIYLSTAGLLAACGGSNDGSAVNPTVEAPMEEATTITRTFAFDTATPSLALAEGKKLTAQSGQIASLNADWTNRVTSNTTETFSIMLNENQELSMEVGGKLYDFRTSDRFIESDGATSYGYVVEGELDSSGNPQYFNLFSYDGTLDQIISGEHEELVQIWKYLTVKDNIDAGTVSGTLGFLVVGSETKTEALGNFSTRVYNGRIRSEVYDGDDFETTQNRFELRSDSLELTANFQNKTISGTAENLVGRERVRGVDAGEFTPIPGSLSFENGVISGADFAGALTVDQVFQDVTEIQEFTGTFSGTFFGQGAEAVGGVIKGTIVEPEGNVSNLVGAFKAD